MCARRTHPRHTKAVVDETTGWSITWQRHRSWPSGNGDPGVGAATSGVLSLTDAVVARISDQLTGQPMF